MDIAADLMELEDEEDFENFLDDLISRGAQAVGRFIDSPTGQALGGALKDAAKQLLPVAGQAVGSYFGGPAGGQIGGALGTAVAGQFEAEAEEQEWEAANVFVRVAVDAVNNAANAPVGAHPQAVAQNAVAEAARRHAPHLAHAFSHPGRDWTSARHSRHSGRWARRGREIIVYGV
jgi:phage tail tape-measure protein